MEKLFKNTFAVLFLLVLTSFTIPATVYICLSPGVKKFKHEVKVSKGVGERKYENENSKNRVADVAKMKKKG